MDDPFNENELHGEVAMNWHCIINNPHIPCKQGVLIDSCAMKFDFVWRRRSKPYALDIARHRVYSLSAGLKLNI